MTHAPLPDNEKDCLMALRRYNILDTPPEASFERITKLTAQLLGAPIALVFLVEEFRAWFKSAQGFEASEVSRDATLCSFALLLEDVLVIPDARKDPRFACNPFVQSEPGVRFYAGVPLITQAGFNLGTLCVLDSQPRSELTAEQQTTLADLAALVVDQLELRRTAQKLEQAEAEQAQLLQAAQQAQAEAEAANASKDEFISVLSHELRTPLNAIQGWASILLNQIQNEATTTRALQTIARNAKLQSQLIEDLLDVTRIVQGKIRLKFRPVNLIPVITAAIDALQPAADEKRIRLQAMLTPCPGTVSADPDRLQQVIWNLLSNAIKFTPEAGQVEVRLACSHTQAQIQIVDTGKGIAPEFLPYVFDRFQQAEGTSNKTHTGLGLGLTIVKNLVELHSGTIAADSLGKGQGATFTVQLPLVSVFAPADQLESCTVAVG